MTLLVHSRLRPPYVLEFWPRPAQGRGQAERDRLEPVFRDIVHASFLDHPEFDRRTLPYYLDCSYVYVLRHQEAAVGCVAANLMAVDGAAVLHLAGGYALPEHQAAGIVNGEMLDEVLALARREAAGDLHVAVRTPNPRAVAAFWAWPEARVHPRPDLPGPDESTRRLARRFCEVTYGLRDYDEADQAVRRTYPIPPWGGQVPWHHDEAVNDFCRRRLDFQAGDALLLFGPVGPEGGAS